MSSAGSDGGPDRRTFLVGTVAAGLAMACRGAPTITPPRGSVPRPVGVVRTAWATDPFSLGSYSYLAVGAEPAMRSWLAAPIEQRLFFAGEATDRDNPATVHGARASGIRVADDVAKAARSGDHIAIIGAGIAGAQAARRLADAGFQVTVLEGRTRIGGRLDTVQPQGWPIPVERGASWVHAIAESDLAPALDALGVATVAFDYRTVVLGGDGRRVEDVDAFLSPAGDAVAAAIRWASEQQDDRSVADAVSQSGTAAGVDPVALQHLYDSEITTEMGTEPRNLSAFWGLDEGSEGDDVLVTGGYGQIVASLLDGLEVRLSTRVTAVTYGSSGVDVTSSSASEAERFDRVVVTVSLGVLQSGAIAFDPPLPAQHRQAIENIGFGVLDKLWLRFDRQFWTDTNLMWTIVDDDGYAEWFNLAPLTGAPVLLALVGGAHARSLAPLTDDEVIATAMRSLQKLIDAGW